MTENDKSAGWTAYYEKLRDRPPRRTLLAALDRFGPPPPDALAIDLGCGDGRDVTEMLRRGWRVFAVDAEPEALRQLQARPLPPGSDVTPIVARLEEVPLPIGVSLVNSSFAMPLCEPAAFHDLWNRIREELPSGGRFSGQWYGPRDSWAGGRADRRRDEALGLLDGLELEMLRGGSRRCHAARHCQALAHLPYRRGCSPSTDIQFIPSIRNGVCWGLDGAIVSIARCCDLPSIVLYFAAASLVLARLWTFGTRSNQRPTPFPWASFSESLLARGTAHLCRRRHRPAAGRSLRPRQHWRSAAVSARRSLDRRSKRLRYRGFHCARG
jgi:SAM-dependent methyltransferase